MHISTFDSIFFSLQALDRRGQARLQLQKFTEALEDFEEAKRIDPKTAAVDKNISSAKAGMGEPAVDKAGAKKAMGEANTEFKKGNYEKAVECYTKVLNSYSGTMNINLNIQAMKLDPGEDVYPANRANVYLKMKKWEEAETDCTDAIKLDPKASKVVRDFSFDINLYFI